MEKNVSGIIYQRTDGKWVTTVEDATGVSSLHNTKQGAENYARKKLECSGGGNLVFKAATGKVRARKQVNAPKKDFLSGIVGLMG